MAWAPECPSDLYRLTTGGRCRILTGADVEHPASRAGCDAAVITCHLAFPRRFRHKLSSSELTASASRRYRRLPFQQLAYDFSSSRTKVSGLGKLHPRRLRRRVQYCRRRTTTPGRCPTAFYCPRQLAIFALRDCSMNSRSSAEAENRTMFSDLICRSARCVVHEEIRRKSIRVMVTPSSCCSSTRASPFTRLTWIQIPSSKRSPPRHAQTSARAQGRGIPQMALSAKTPPVPENDIRPVTDVSRATWNLHDVGYGARGRYGGQR